MLYKDKKEEIWLSPLTKKKPYTNRKIQKATRQHKTDTKNVDYTMSTDQLRAVSESNNSNPTGVVKPVYERSTFTLTKTAVLLIGHSF